MTDVAGELSAILVDSFDVVCGDIIAHRTLEELGVDSVAAVELADIIREKFDVALDDEELTTGTTMEQLISTIADGTS
ncbi:acyl carrier protein [Saccharopolyspora sp. 5N708]|uniref:acyl carrier protein n=1 Tax=Saccharopolyspora sp. 5N708 TaxID=3457424 RepID=UPI003FD634F9